MSYQEEAQVLLSKQVLADESDAVRVVADVMLWKYDLALTEERITAIVVASQPFVSVDSVPPALERLKKLKALRSRRGQGVTLYEVNY